MEDDMDRIGWEFNNITEEAMENVATKDEIKDLTTKKEEILLKIEEQFATIKQLILMSK